VSNGCYGKFLRDFGRGLPFSRLDEGLPKILALALILAAILVIGMLVGALIGPSS
jgi:hypothetical protein